MKPSIVVVDDFLTYPDQDRELALTLSYARSPDYKGWRSEENCLNDSLKRSFEKLLNRRITSWEDQPMNGKYQFCTPTDPIVFHCDGQSHAGTIYLTPNAPLESGLCLYRHKASGKRHCRTDEDAALLFSGEGDNRFFDSTRWELVDRIANVYNRLVLFDARHVHAAGAYFGSTISDARLFAMFFFQAE